METTLTAPADDKPARLPLWKSVAEELINMGLHYGDQFTRDFFEIKLRSKSDTTEFAFEMAQLRQHIEAQTGYYLRETNNGAIYEIPSPLEHGEYGDKFDRQAKSFAVRAVNIRQCTLLNPEARLSEDDERRISRKLEIAQTRLALMSRTMTFAKSIQKHQPKLLK